MLTASAAPGQYWKGNLHGHSSLSDGALTPQAACARYRDAGYDFVAITDHFRPVYGYPLTDTRPFRDAGFTTLLGAELHAPATARGAEWHILAVGLPEDFVPNAEGETGPALAARAAGAGAFVAIAHPHWYQLTPEDGAALSAAHAVEVYNHTSHVHCDRGDGLMFYDALLSQGRRLSALAVDDSHWKAEDAFGGWVMVRAEANEPDALLAALHAGAFYATQGPTLDEVRREGAEIVVACSPARTIALVGPGSENVRALGRDLTGARLPLDRFMGRWCRLVVVDAQSRRAWSNPLWLD